MCWNRGYKYLYIPLNFVINLKMFSKIKSSFKVIAKRYSELLEVGLNMIAISLSHISDFHLHLRAYFFLLVTTGPLVLTAN